MRKQSRSPSSTASETRMGAPPPGAAQPPTARHVIAAKGRRRLGGAPWVEERSLLAYTDRRMKGPFDQHRTILDPLKKASFPPDAGIGHQPARRQSRPRAQPLR